MNMRRPRLLAATLLASFLVMACSTSPEPTITELIGEAVPAVHYAMFDSPEVRNAATDFDHVTNSIVAFVELSDDISEDDVDSVLAELHARATRAVAEVAPRLLDLAAVSVIRSEEIGFGWPTPDGD
jgi:hypothetical protein